MVCSWLSEQNSDLSKHCIEPLILLYWTFCYSHFNMCVPANLLQACLTLCHPMDYSLPGSSVHGILQARILEWIAMSPSRESSRPRDRACVSYVSCTGKRVFYQQYHLGSPLFQCTILLIPCPNSVVSLFTMSDFLFCLAHSYSYYKARQLSPASPRQP